MALVLAHLIKVLVLLGFAYIVLIQAGKQTGNTKLVGQIIAWAIVVVLVLAGASCKMGKGCPMMGDKCGKHQEMKCDEMKDMKDMKDMKAAPAAPAAADVKAPAKK